MEMCRESEFPPTEELWWILKINKHFPPLVGEVSQPRQLTMSK